MKNRFTGILSLTLLLSLMAMLPACNKEWDKHYDESTFNLSGLSSNQYIQSQPQLSIFAQMLKKTGYDTIIGNSQSYTVWAPTNDALQGIDVNNTDVVLEIVRNHIARNLISTSGITNKPVYMLNNKFIAFTRTANEYQFGRKTVTLANVLTSNGLVHVTNGFAPYVNNIWEHIMKTEGFDSLKTYLLSKNTRIFDPENSTEIGYNSDNKPVYDSAFINSNSILEKFGALDNEDSTYTAILPNNAAWRDGYSRILPYFIFSNDEGGTARQRDKVKLTMVQDLVFRGVHNQPAALDSLVSTNNNVFYNPGYLFENSTQVEMSNGLAYITPLLKHQSKSSWHKEIKVEAESSLGRVLLNANAFTRPAFGTGFEVSDNRYAAFESTSSTQVYVNFTIPNTLSAKYNIYVVFVPAIIENEADILPVKVRFQLTYVRTASGTASPPRSFTSTGYITNPSQVTKMFVGEHTFPYASLVDEAYPFNKIKTQLRVINDGLASPTLYNKTMRIDCIILEPVN